MSSIIRILSIALLLLLHLQAMSMASDSLRVEKSKGKKFIVHRVEPKETLYSISKKYDVSIEDIQKYNPEIADGLKMYQEVLIPINKKKASKAKEKEVVSEKSDPQYHIVQQGETMYSLSKKYNVSIDSLMTVNHLTSSALKLGDTLILTKPNIRKEAVSKNAEIRLKDKTPTEVKKNHESVTSTQPQYSYHLVEDGETMFAISRKYNVTLAQLTEWNHMDSYELEIGQKIIVGKSENATLISLPEKNKQNTEPEIATSKKEIPEKTKTETIVLPLPKKSTENDTIFLKTDNKPFRTKIEEVDGQKIVFEEGFVMKMDNTEHVTKLLALHKTAPIGTTIKVVNVMNGLVIDVKVVGNLPETALDRNVMMRLSSPAFKKLASPDDKVPVKTSYVKE